jgi:hypothetical protein
MHSESMLWSSQGISGDQVPCLHGDKIVRLFGRLYPEAAKRPIQRLYDDHDQRLFGDYIERLPFRAIMSQKMKDEAASKIFLGGSYICITESIELLNN